MSVLPGFSRRVLLRSLPLALPLLYGCGGGNGNENPDSLGADAPLVVNGETVAQLRLRRRDDDGRGRSRITNPDPILYSLQVQNTGTREIARLRVYLRALGRYLSVVDLNALPQGAVFQANDLFLNLPVKRFETFVSELQFRGEPMLGGPFSGPLIGDFTATGDRSLTGRFYGTVTVENQLVGDVRAEVVSSRETFNEPIIGVVDSEGNITATLGHTQNVVRYNASGTLRNEGNGFRLNFSVAPKVFGAERFSAFLRRDAA